jgi:hypothetical protein
VTATITVAAPRANVDVTIVERRPPWSLGGQRWLGSLEKAIEHPEIA